MVGAPTNDDATEAVATELDGDPLAFIDHLFRQVAQVETSAVVDGGQLLVFLGVGLPGPGDCPSQFGSEVGVLLEGDVFALSTSSGRQRIGCGRI
jgi:hypothetical protein